jgi:hypothetical protein
MHRSRHRVTVRCSCCVYPVRTAASLYVFLHNWVELLITAIQCGREC